MDVCHVTQSTDKRCVVFNLDIQIEIGMKYTRHTDTMSIYYWVGILGRLAVSKSCKDFFRMGWPWGGTRYRRVNEEANSLLSSVRSTSLEYDAEIAVFETQSNINNKEVWIVIIFTQ